MDSAISRLRAGTDAVGGALARTEDQVFCIPLYDQAALETMAENAARVARDAEAYYWRSAVDALAAQAGEWNRRYMALVQQVADGRAMQPAPPILADLGPNVRANLDPTAAPKHE
jgi:hypothetical protein